MPLLFLEGEVGLGMSTIQERDVLELYIWDKHALPADAHERRLRLYLDREEAVELFGRLGEILERHGWVGDSP